MENKISLWSKRDTLVLICVLLIITSYILIHIAPEYSYNWAIKTKKVDTSILATYKYISMLLTAILFNVTGILGIFYNNKAKH